MLVNMQEFGGCFDVELTAETVEEAALLVRFGLNRTKEVRSAEAYATSGQITGSIVLGKRKEAKSRIEPASR